MVVADPATPPAGAKILKYAIALPPVDQAAQEVQKMANRFNSRQSQYYIQIFAGGALGSESEYPKMISSGTIHFMFEPSQIQGDLDQRLSVLNIPFLFDSWDAFNAAIPELKALHDPVFEKLNEKIVGVWSMTPNDFVFTKPVKTLEDFKGLMIGTNDPNAAGVVIALGGNPVTVPPFDSTQSMQKGVINGTIGGAGPPTIVLKIYEVAKYALQSQIWYSMVVQSMNKDAFDSMPADIQKILMEEVATQTKAIQQYYVDVQPGTLAQLKQMGMDIYTLPAAERARWVDKVQGFSADLEAKLGDYATQVMAIADKYNALYPNK